MVSNDSKLPNSARNAIKKIWRRKTAVDGGSGGTAAIFYSNIFYWPTSKDFVSISFNIHLDKRGFEKI